MKMLTILQLVEIFAAYSVMTLVLPALLFYSRIRHLKFAVRFMVYQIAGNFYMMNLVFLLQLLHISYGVTLWLFTLVPFLAAYFLLHKKHPLRAAETALEMFRRLAGGQLGMRLFLRRIRTACTDACKRAGRILGRRLGRNFLDVVLVAGLTVLLLYLYGSNALTDYGYSASDVPVHNYWINSMGQNKIFVAGVYPFGFHCVIYYLHTVFGIETYVLLRLFWLVQTVMIHYLLLAFIRACCKSPYIAYLGVGIYTAVGIFGPNTYTRYYSSLPQEFGMLFILPSIYFLFAFFERKQYEQEHYKEKKFADWYLAGFGMSFAMTLSSHFYDTMIAGLFCLGIAVGYCFRLFRKPYFKKILLSGILSVGIAVLPMGIAFATGTQLQGSLGWGMKVITGENSEEQQSDTEAATEQTGKPETFTGTGKPVEGASGEADRGGGGKEPSVEGQEGSVILLTDLLKQKAAALGNRLQALGDKTLTAVWNCIVTYLIPGERMMFQLAVLLSILLLGLLAVIFFLLKQKDYAARFLSTAVYMVLLSVVFAASGIGLPSLMDAIRTCIFYAYTIVVVWSFCADGILQLLFGWMKKKWLMNLAALALVLAAGVHTVQAGLVKEPESVEALQTNEAITCLTNIIHDNADKTWTICSASDELRMAEDYGYHEEISTFLGKMEYSGGLGTIQIPTHTVYFFVEKRPLDYAVEYENSGQYVSRAGASRKLPAAKGISMYQGENRWIEMSRMYYWAQKFMELYPNEMDVYYETENFVCYRVVQNDYRLYNFSIDYGYNMMKHEEKE